MVNVTIDNKKIQVPAGTKILEAALQNNIEIPHLCYHPELVPFGGCRLCLVEVQGQSDLVSSCVTPISEGMEVHTATPRILRARRTIVQLLLLNHPMDCLVCDRGGNCQLQKLAFELHVKPEQYRMKKRVTKSLQKRTILEVDPKKCVHCGLCVRTCKEIRHQGAIDFYNRGFRTEIGIPYADESNCEFCGQCIEVCPVAGVIGLDTKYIARPWEVKQVHTVCPYCGTGCLLTLHTKTDKIAKVSSDDKSGVNEGKICVRGRFGCGFIKSEDRLTTPLIKKNGTLQPASWDEALEYTANRLKTLVNQYGGKAIGGLGSVKCSNEDNYLFQKFMRACIGTNHIDNPARLEHAPTIKALSETLGVVTSNNSLDKISTADLILVIGSNPADTHPIISLKIKTAVISGHSKLIIIDPRKTKLTVVAHKWVALRPGSDLTLLGAVMQTMLQTGLCQIPDKSENWEAFAQSLAGYDQELAAKICGLKSDEIVDLAQEIAKAKSLAVIYSSGLAQQTNGTQNVATLGDLFLLTGHNQNENSGIYALLSGSNSQGACDMGVLPDYLPGYQSLLKSNSRTKFEQAWQCKLPAEAGFPAHQMFKAIQDGAIKALYIMGDNPLRRYSNSQTIKNALSSLDFLVVQDMFLSPTAELADVVFPAASFAEREGTVTNMERRVQKTTKALAAPGQAKSDWKIISLLATKMGYAMNYATSNEIMQEINSLVPTYAGITYSRLKEGGIFWPCPDATHPGSKFLKPGQSIEGKYDLQPLPAITAQEEVNLEYPFKLIVCKTLFHSASGTLSMRSKVLKEISPQGYVHINPQDAAKLGISENDSVNIISSRGNLHAKARFAPLSPTGIVFAPIQFSEFPVQELLPELYDPISQSPAMKSCLVNLVRLES